MHTVIVVGGAFALLLACLLLGHAFGGRPGMLLGAKLFIPLWLIGAGINLWVGVSRAGYSVAEELPIFLGVFGVPAVVAALVWWRWSS
jgi:hypothetical protein